MSKRFLEYLGSEIPTLPDSTPLDRTDTWPAMFKDDRDYLQTEISGLEKELDQMHKTVRKNFGNKNAQIPKT